MEDLVSKISNYLDNNSNSGFLLTKFANRENCELYCGNIYNFDTIADVKKFANSDGKYIFAIPFCHIAEKYPSLPKSNKKIPLIKVNNSFEISYIQYNAELSFDVQNAKFDDSDEGFKQKVSDVIQKEIYNGEGSNFLISRRMTGNITNFSLSQAINLFAKFLQVEYGYYQIFCFFDGKNFLIGASPECHINIQNNRIRMQPISGTYRKKFTNINDERLSLLKFLKDQKEINELFMVVDEELKMMARMCIRGGRMIGPRLREMSKLIHTEYFLTGETDMDVFDCIKDSMHAATVVGGPLENAFRIGMKYNPEPSYFASQIGIFEKNGNEQSFDSAILIRTAEIAKSGDFKLYAGATIVRDSIPESELLEVNAKLSRMLSNFSDNNTQESKAILPYLLFDHEIQEALYIRNRNLSKFWMFEQGDYSVDNRLAGKNAIIINNDDDFVNMQAHIMRKMGLNVQIVKYDEYKFSGEDITIVGPGPGNPNDINCEKMQIVTDIVKELIANNRKFMSICLGHQILCKTLGFDVKRAKKVSQGEQKLINFFGKEEFVGMYNTFFGIQHKNLPNIEFVTDENNQIYAMRGRNFVSMQFHPESLLTVNGYEIIFNTLCEVLYENNAKISNG